MEISVRKGSLVEEKVDLLVIGVREGEGEKALKGHLQTVAKEDHFKGKLGEAMVVRGDQSVKAKRVLLLGLGKKEDLTSESVREAAACMMNEAERLGVKTVVAALFDQKLSAKTVAKSMVEGARLAAYKFDAYKKKKNKPSVQAFTIVAPDARSVAQTMAGVTVGELGVEGTLLARDLVNQPAAHTHPAELVNIAQGIVKASKGKIKMKVMDKAACEKAGMGAFLGIAQGSDHPPYFVHMRYEPRGAKKRVALVGKAITFDSGGLSIKPAEYMYTMKLDMAGAAAVLGVFKVLTRLNLNIAVDGIFAACENMPSGKAIRPGDVVTAMNGTTIEVLHTDAEGRVTLADALSYAVKLKPDAMIDLATLTGACMVALGEEIVGSMSNNPKLENKVLMAAAEAGEKMWSLPLEKNYKRELKSEVADLKNLAGRYGGALTAGLFLQEFVEGLPWVHLDIAGPAFAEKPMNAYTSRGATGVGVRTLIEFLKAF